MFQIAIGDYQKDPFNQPEAANMRQLTWDNELAKVAQRWANQCIYAHDGEDGLRR